MSIFYCLDKFRSTFACCAILLHTAFTPVARAESAAQLEEPPFENAATAGQATLRWLGFKVFDAALMTPMGRPYGKNLKAALRLEYHMAFSQRELVASTLSEMKRIEGAHVDHTQLATQLETCFLDVGRRDNYLAYGPSPDQITFFRNGQQTCELKSPGIRSRILAVWLAPNSRFPALSRKLRGQE